MCGIAGFFGSFSAESLERASVSIAHRGPDAHGIWRDPDAGVGLAHRRLSIIDLSSTGAQPMLSDDGSVVLIFNGEIYNFRELRASLEARGSRFRGSSDTEVVLRLYQEEGAAMLSKLNGIFAVALWDGRDRSLLLARDAMGVKPLYFSALSRGVVFASEIKAMLKLAPEVRDLDAQALHRYLTFLWCPGDGTPLKAVRKLNPGEALVVRNGRIERRWVWYQLPAVRGAVAPVNESEAREGVVAHLRRAVQRQLVADVPVGAFLSGGIDSSAVVAFAREQSPSIRCFSIEVDGGHEPGTDDDLPYARQVATHLGVPLEVVKIDASRMAMDLESMVVRLDEPLADPAPLNALYISTLARAQGIKVLLSGVGGDDLFTGYRRHTAVNFQALWSWVPARLRTRMEDAGTGLSQSFPTGRRLARLLTGFGLDGDRRLAAYFSWAREANLMALYTADFRAALAGVDASEPMVSYLETVPNEVCDLDRMLALEQRFFLADHNLIYTDKMSMAAGVEVRVPFLDLELVDFAARVPARLKQRGMVGKWILKEAMKGYLPHDVIRRPKTGFGAPLRRWIKHELRPLVSDLLSSESLKRRGLFDPPAVQDLIARNDSGRVDAAYTLLSLMTIEIWCRAFLDAQPAQP